VTKTLYPVYPVLLVDDEEQFLSSAGFILKGAGITNIVPCSDSRQVMPLVRERVFSVIVLDLSMPYIPGTQLLPEIVENAPDTPVIIITAVNEVETAVQCMKEGALDYLVKPVQSDAFINAVNRALKFHEIDAENSRLKKYVLSDELTRPDAFAGIITESKQMHGIFKYIEAAAETALPVLITGETGVGKESLAKAIHTLSNRGGSFVPVNAAGLDDTLFSDTLFGHKKGSFTGAAADRKGMIEAAAGGTLFLDEIGDLSIPSQVKLLRLLQDGTYYPLGSDSQKKTDARFIFATNINLEEAISKGLFRKDLYYRLRSHRIRVPALRERPEDIPRLFTYFLEQAAKTLNKNVPSFPSQVLTLLAGYSFPGNIRELQTMVFDAAARHQKGILSMKSFKDIIGSEPVFPDEKESLSRIEATDLINLFNGRFPRLKEVEQVLISEALKIAANNQGIAASLLGISRNALNKRLVRAEKKKASY
jgi:two-component system response regulator HydG